MRPITDLFREAGYFTANVKTPAKGLRVGGKTDFNFNTDHPVFDGTTGTSARQASRFTPRSTSTSRTAAVPGPTPDERSTFSADPSKVDLPPEYADHPVIRDDWANYLDAISCST